MSHGFPSIGLPLSEYIGFIEQQFSGVYATSFVFMLLSA